jgi:NAD(P)-dependent dehydrogenase (short-subunit alcohol dehydrogenase family)
MKVEAGQVAVITGGASGIGYALAQELGSRKVAVVIADVRPEGLATAESALRDDGVDVLAVQTDVSRAEAVQHLADETIARFGRVDLVVNNAGIGVPSVPMWEQDLSTWSRIIDIKLMGVVHGIRSFAPLLVAQGHGHIVNTASAGGLIPLPDMTPYSATMHAVVGVTETLDVELKRVSDQLGATVLCPGLVATPLYANSAALQSANEDVLGSEQAKQLVAAMADGSPHAASPRQVAKETIDAVEAGRLHAIVAVGPGADGIRQRAELVIADAAAGS